MRTLEKVVVVRELLHLRGRRIDQFLSAVACVHTPETRHPVKDLAAIGVIDVDTFRARNDA